MHTNKLSELFPLRLTATLKQAIQEEALACGVRPVDIARTAISAAVAHRIKNIAPPQASRDSIEGEL